jgi:hypothetical protein
MTGILTSDPTWATDATVTSGAEATKAVRVVPTAGIRAQGFQADQGVPARLLNNQLGVQGDWIKWLNKAVPTRLYDPGRIIRVPLAGVAEVQNPTDIATDSYQLTCPYLSTGLDKFNTHLLQILSDRVFVWQLSDVLPPEGLLTSIRIVCKGSDEWITLPDQLPNISVVYIQASDETVHTIRLANDTSATPAAFMGSHPIDLDLSDAPIDLYTAGFGFSVRIMLVVEGAAASSWLGPVEFYDIQAVVTSKP